MKLGCGGTPSAPVCGGDGAKHIPMMKRLAVFFALAALLCVQGMAQAVAKFDTPKHDFGTFPESQRMSHEFVFENTGDKPLVIQQAYASCGCTVAKYTQEPVAPGAKGKVMVTYNGKGKVPGHFKKAVTVVSNASNKMVRLYIEGNMTEDKTDGK